MLVDFFQYLREKYNFIITPENVIQGCKKIPDITVIDSVFYTLQALVCNCEEDIAKYTKAFVEFFSFALPKDSLQTIKPKKGEDPEKEAERVQRQIAITKKNVEQYNEVVSSLEKKREELQKPASALNDEQRGPSTGDKSFNSQLLQEFDNACKTNKELYDIIPKNCFKNSLFPDGLKKCKQELLNEAANIDSKLPMSKFMETLDFIDACAKKPLQKYKKSASGERKEKKDKKATEELDTINYRLTMLSRSVETEENKLKTLENRKAELLVMKTESKNNRPEFLSGHRSVQLFSEVQGVFSKQISTLSIEEHNMVLSYLHTNSRVFKQTLRQKNITPTKRIVSVKDTVRAAIKSGGEVTAFKYKKPIKSHAKIICLADISGSCRKMADIALEYFSVVQDVFPAGCHSFVFVNRLVDVTRFYKEYSSTEAVEKISNEVPTKGVYSNYSIPILQLSEDYKGLLNKETTIIIIGDARNNENDSQAAVFADICSRVYKCFWLNTDKKEDANTGDSVIGLYEQAGADISYVSSVKDLLSFLQSSSEKSIS